MNDVPERNAHFLLKSVGEHSLQLGLDLDLFVENTKGYVFEVSYSRNFVVKQYLLGNDVDEKSSLLNFVLAFHQLIGYSLSKRKVLIFAEHAVVALLVLSEHAVHLAILKLFDGTNELNW